MQKIPDHKQNRFLYCKQCKTKITSIDYILQKEFQGNKLLVLFRKAINVDFGDPRGTLESTEIRSFVSCNHCKRTLGWKYVSNGYEREYNVEGRLALFKDFLTKSSSRWVYGAPSLLDMLQAVRPGNVVRRQMTRLGGLGLDAGFQRYRSLSALFE